MALAIGLAATSCACPRYPLTRVTLTCPTAFRTTERQLTGLWVQFRPLATLPT